MMPFLLSFGCGIAFAVGVFVGICICGMTQKSVRKAVSEDMVKFHEKHLELFTQQVAFMSQNSKSLEAIANAQTLKAKNQ